MKRNGKILVTSLKGGVGKSTVAASLSAALANSGDKVALVDLDFRSRSLEIMLGACDEAAFTLYDYMKDRIETDSLTLKIKTSKSEFLFCPAPREDLFDAEGSALYEKIPEYLNKIADETGVDYIICDSGADSYVPGIAAKSFANYALVVSEQSRTAIRAAETTAQKLAEYESIKNVRLVINNFDVEGARAGKRAGLIEMIDDCAARCVGVIPHDPKLPELQDRGATPDGKEISAVAAKNIASRIKGEQVPLFTNMKKLRKKIIL